MPCFVLQEVMVIVGDFLANATLANGGTPPLAVSYDAATANCMVSAACVGLMSESEMSRYPFFDCCAIGKISAIMWPYGYLTFVSPETKMSFTMASSLGAYHGQKRFMVK